MTSPTDPPTECAFCGNSEHRDFTLDGRVKLRAFECHMQWNHKTSEWSFFHVNVYGQAETAAAHFAIQAERAGLSFT